MIKINTQSECFENVKAQLKECIRDLLFDKNGYAYHFNTFYILAKIAFENGREIDHKFCTIMQDFSHDKIDLNMNNYRTEKGLISKEFTDLLSYRFKQWLLNYTKITDSELTSFTKSDAKDFVKLFEKLGVF